MVKKRMLIVPAELIDRIDENRGDMSQAEFIDFLIDSQLIDSQLKEETKGLKHATKEQQYVTREEIRSLEQDIKKLLRSFLDFFVSYGLEMGKQSPKTEFEELVGKLQGLEKELSSDSEKGTATIKWK